MLKINLLLSVFILLVSTITSQSEAENFSPLNNRAFIENVGQFDGRNWHSSIPIEYAVAENPFYVFFSKKGMTYRFDKVIRNPKRDKSNPNSPKRTSVSELIQVEWVGANPNVQIVAEEKTRNTYSYAVKDFSSNNVSNLSDIKGFKKILYKNLYNNIDVEYVFHPDGGVKYSVILHPGANPNEVQLKYSTSSTHLQNEKIDISLNSAGQLNINTSLGDLIEDKPFTYYQTSKEAISSAYKFENNLLTFELENYDNSQEVVIDPWLNNSTYSTSGAVWEVETDGAGNVYTIGGETPMELKKFNAAGALQWTYVTPWDTSNTWLGTLATDDLGTSYVTSGTSQEIERIDNAGNMVWHSNNPGFSQEYWSITFNCDNTKLIVGGTQTQSLLSFDFEATIFDIDINNGSVLSSMLVASTNIGGIGVTPVEVRSISSSKNAKYIFLTHEEVGAVNQDLGACPNAAPTYQVDNQANLGYKCENYLPATQNGGGLKALVANDTYFYTHSGDQIRQWDLATGALVNTVNLAGGVSTTVPLIGGLVVENSGLDVDDCGNVYAGSTNSVVKFDQNLNVLSTSATTFAVYDVSVNSNGEVLAVGAQSDNSATTRNGRIESINMSACAQYSLVCCDPSFCEPNPLCDTDLPINLSSNTAGGTWSSVPATAGLNATTGAFDPVLAGAGNYEVTYTLACGNESHSVVVTSCTAMSVCLETNGDLTVTGGSGPYSWQSQSTFTDCSGCFGGSCVPFVCEGVEAPNWTDAGTTVAGPGAGLYPIEVIDNNGTVLVITSSGTLASCSAGCVTTGPEGCGSGGYVWQYTVTSGGAIDVTTLTPAGNWSVSYDNGATWTALTAPITLNTVGDIWILGVDPDPADALNFATGAWDFTDCSSTVNNVSVGHDCILDGCPNCTPGCVTTVTEGCGNGGYTWEYSLTAGATIDVTSLTPAGSWFVSYDNGATWVTLTAPSTINTAGDVWILGVDPDPADFLVFAQGAWNFTDCSSTVNNVSGGHDCILDGCTSCGIVCTPPTLADTQIDVTCLGGNDGSIDLTVTGTSTYDFLWSNTAITEDLSGLIAGIYSVTVTDQVDGTCTATASVTIIDGGQPSVVANASTLSICQGDPVTLSGSGASTYTWTGTITPTDGVPFNPTVTDTYTVTGTDVSGCTNTDMITVTVNNCSQPTASFVASSTVLCENDCIDFTDQSTGTTISTWAWSFPGATTTISSDQNPTNICYPTAGTYDVTLVVTDANGTDDSTVVSYITVSNCTQPTASFTASNTALCENDCINFTDLSTGTTISTWAWSFPGATTATSSDQNPTNICYPTAGTYDVTLVVTDANGTDDSTIVSYITVNNCTQPTASFAASNTALCENDCINFTDQSTGTNINTWAWSFPGAITTASSDQNPASICYATSGTYTVTLTVTDDNGTDDSTMVSYIVVTNCTTPTAAFSASSTSICQGDCIDFTDQSTSTVGVVSYSWSFPGSSTTTSTSQNPTNICYSAAGTYNVVLTITDDNGTDVSTMTNYITVANCTTPTANFSISDTEICQGECIDFTDLSTGGATSWEWTFAGGFPSTSTDQNPAGICFLTDGTVNVTLVALNSMGSDTITQTITVNVSPTVDAGPNVTINAGVSTTLEATGSVGNYVWSPDSALSCTLCQITEASPEYTTTYIVTVTDANGCSAFDDVEVATIFIEGIGVPSAFSPNGDNHNDILYVEGAGIIELEFMVYNRYGQLVFESFDKDIGWDGTLNGKPENPGVFAYIAVYKLIGGGEGVLKGDVTLIK